MSELTDLRRRVRQAIQDARNKAAARRTSRDEASRAWDVALDQVVVPLSRDMAAALTGEGLGFRLDTPGRVARLVSDKSPDDYIEIALDDSDDAESPEVLGRIVRGRGRQNVVVIEEPLGAPAGMAVDRLTAYFTKAIAYWVR
ncbi:MAG: hypothetical protein M3R55_11295 [Acidobacteriota bacterium]|nr:hypothetical protein [Acidobacteriota bacterium]